VNEILIKNLTAKFILHTPFLV